jgi:hypothetical protein
MKMLFHDLTFTFLMIVHRLNLCSPKAYNNAYWAIWDSQQKDGFSKVK